MRPKISIVVPIYNVENYLSRCLESLLEQTLKDIEIIAINDGSTDLSLEILLEYEQLDERIKVITQSNAGVSSARNLGIKHCNGEFIGFVDPDDWVNKTMYEELYNQAVKARAEIVMCSYIREFGTHSKLKVFDLPSSTLYENEEVQLKIMRRLVGPIKDEVANPEMLDSWGTVWSKLYKTDLIRGNNLLFMDLNKIGTNEDTLFNIEATYHAKSFLFINKALYHYWRANETSVTSGFKPNLIEQWLFLFAYIEDYLKEKKLNNIFFLALRNRICLNTLGLGLNTISRANKSTSLIKIKNINVFLKEKKINESFKQFELSKLPIVWRIFYFCAKMRFALGFYILLECIEFLRKLMR